MPKITTTLSDDQWTQLRAWADLAGVSPEELFGQHVEAMFAARAEQFQRAATTVLEKNRELYRRLA